MDKFLNASVIVTALRETDSLQHTVDIVLNTCNHSDLKEIIIVLAEISTEGCIKKAKELSGKQTDTLIKVFFQKKPFIGGAFQDAFDIAEGSHVVMLAADMDTDPGIVYKFIEKSKEYPNRIITATRWKKGGGFVGYNKIKKIFNFIFNRIFSIIYLTNISDMTFGFRLMPTKLVQSIAWEELKHPFYLETAVKPLRLGVKFVEIPAVWRANPGNESINSFFSNFSYFRTGLQNKFISRKKILK